MRKIYWLWLVCGFSCCTGKVATHNSAAAADSIVHTRTAAMAPKRDTNVTGANSPAPVIQQDMNIDYSGPPTLVYKMKAYYHTLVPVMMNEEKTRIVSYPAPGDLTNNGHPATPVSLHGNYWLDNRGIGPQTVFLNITYQDYSALKQAPTLQEMMQLIKEKYPLLEIYSCGNRYQYKDLPDDLNKIIDAGNLKKFKRLL